MEINMNEKKVMEIRINGKEGDGNKNEREGDGDKDEWKRR
jgi:hypothetical protein